MVAVNWLELERSRDLQEGRDGSGSGIVEAGI